MKQKTTTPNRARKLFLPHNRIDPFVTQGSSLAGSSQYWRGGDDNLFPEALALMARRSTTHRRIINDKADYISGKGFIYDNEIPRLAYFIESANGHGETLRQIFNKLAFDKSLFGNAFLEIVTTTNHDFLSLFHQDASKCRLAKDGKHVLLHHDWHQFSTANAKQLPLYPLFEKFPDGTIRSIFHYKDYEPMFEHYGLPPYIAGMNVSAIAYKTDKWNISRLDNSFQLSGIMVLDGNVDNEQDAYEIIRTAEKRFAGEPGQVMFMVKNAEEADNSKFVPITSTNEGDWKNLHDQAVTDIVVAHSWFRSLSGLDYLSGFSSERILQEYEIALNTLILGAQQELLEPIQIIINRILDCDASSMQVINRPPTRSKPLYMKVWEARRADGLDYDTDDPEQNLFLAQITKYALRNID